MRVEPCISPPAWAAANERGLELAHELHSSGEFGYAGGSPREPRGLVHVIGFPRHSDAVLPLNVEEHTPMSVLTEVLDALRDAKIKSVLLLGTSTISGEFATLGPWRRRVHCVLGVLHFDDPERNIGEFEGFAELAAAASVDGGLHLELTPAPGPRL
jgi:hypothetical protein